MPCAEIVRRLLRDIAARRVLGDTTPADPAVVDALRQKYEDMGQTERRIPVAGDEGGEAVCYLQYADGDGRLRSPAERRAAELSPVLALRIAARTPTALARFWAAVLGAVVEGGDDDSASVVDPSGRIPRLLFVSGTPGPGIEIELAVQDLRVLIARCLDLGAAVVEHGSSHAVLTDPAGYRFHLHI